MSIVGNEAFGVAAVPLLVQSAGQAQRPAGVLAVAVHLDDSYLRVRSRVGEPLSFSLVAPATVLASSGPQPAQEVLLTAAQRAISGSSRSAGVTDGRFVVATAIGADVGRGSPGELAFVTSVPTTVVDDAQTPSSATCSSWCWRRRSCPSVVRPCSASASAAGCAA